MLIIDSRKFISASFESEAELEKVVIDNAEYIFGPGSTYFPKKLITTRDGFGTIPDGFVVDVSTRKWFIVEAELARHSVWSHIAPQVAKQLIAATNPATKQLLVNLIVDQFQADNSLKQRFVDEGIPEIDIRHVLGEILDDKPTIGMPIDSVSQDLKEWAATLKVNVKLWMIRKYIEFGKPENVMYEVPEEYKPVFETEDLEPTNTTGPTRYDVTVADLISAGFLRAGDKLFLFYRPRGGERREYEATIHDDGSIEVLGKVFNAPSYAALYAMEDASTTRSTVNGWAVWKTADGTTLSELRERLLVRSPDSGEATC